MPKPVAQQIGRVYLVGAGPGHPGLVTLRGVECLRLADVVLYDYLVNPQLLEHARSTAELVCLGRHGRGRLWTQEEINHRMIEAARQGSNVVRLKAGDPAVFARAAEEAEALTAAGVAFEIVPGSTAALASGSHAGVPLTHRQVSSAVAIVTGHEDTEKEQPPLDYRQLGAFPGTIVIYMGVTSAAEWSAELIAGGKSPDTPVAIVRRCSWPDQSVHRTRLGDLGTFVIQSRLRPPVIFIVGMAAADESSVAWFTSRPLFGQRVLVTRAEGQAGALRDLLQDAGAEVLLQPVIAIEPPLEWKAVDDALARLDTFDWVVFSSANGVSHWLDRLAMLGKDARSFGPAKIAAIGPGTADELAKYRLRADLVPDEYRAESLADALSPSAAGKRILLVRASRGREVLAERLIAAGATVEQVVVYRSVDVTTPDTDIAATLADGRIHWITVTSSAIARSLVALFGEHLHKTRLASISPITSQTLRELGHEPAAEAREYTMPGILAAICDKSSQH